ncbi:MAG: PHP domain-containing protein [Candidatus Aenigmarchaeota archaeon]|nr:PHP domain-containing protein [Candidatus Aenigmarchaeota archaeon]
MKYELHCHTYHSRGQKITWEAPMKPEEIFSILKKKGFSGVALTDHDTIKCWPEARKAARKHGMLFIPGVEVTSSSGHMLALGINEHVKSGMSVDETVDAVHSQGGIVVAPHPFDLRSEGIGEEFRKCDAGEVFNSLNLSRFENMISRRHVEKAGIPAVGGSDAHFPLMLGRTVNHINAETMDGVFSEIMKNRVRIDGSYTPIPVVVDWARERMRLSYEDIVKYVDRTYSPAKAKFAKFMLRKFVNSDSFAWDALGYFSIGTSVVYSAFVNASRKF